MNMLPSSNQPQNVRAEIVQNAPREMSIGMVMQSIWRHRFFMLVWLILVVGLASLVIFNLPVTFFKGMLDVALTFLVYKPLSPVLHGRR